MKLANIIKLAASVVVLIVLAIVAASCGTTVGADEIVVKQDAFGSGLEVWSEPGFHMALFGRITRYKRSAQYWFSAMENEGKKDDESIKVRFNDGGHGTVSGSLRYDLPTDSEHMIKLHMKFHSMKAIDHELIRQVVNKSVFMTGPLMSSRESYAEKRADLINFITDQILNGVYRTKREAVKVTDPVSGQDKLVEIVHPRQGEGPNGIEREEVSPINEFGIRTYNIAINGIEYDKAIEDQIQAQQAAVNAVQQAMVDARKAEQKALTATKEGETEATKAKWVQEKEKATATTKAEQDKAVAMLKAEQDKAVAELELQTANLNKQTKIVAAQGESESKKLVTAANNNFEEKLAAWKEVNKAYAEALSKQRWVPDIQMGPAGNGGGPVDLMTMLQIQTAKQLQLSFQPQK